MPKIKTKTPKRKSLHPTKQLLLALGLFFITVYASRGEQITGWEVAVFNVVYGLPDFLKPFFLIITQFGSIYILAILLAIYLVIKRHYHVILRLLLTGGLAYVITGVAKDLWGRARPHDQLLDVVSLEFVVRGPGFPSGHVALAAALALTIGHYLPKKYYWVPVVWIVGVALSRMYLGIHAPLDLIGGFAIGWAAYALFRHVRLYDITFGSRSAKKLKAKN